MPSFDATGPIEANIDLALGDLRVRATDRATVEVDVRPSDPSDPADVEAAGQFEVSFTDGRLVVRDPRRAGLDLVRSWLSRGPNGSVDVVVDLPERSSLEASLGSGDLDGEGRLGDVKVRTGLGTIRLDATDALDARSGAGDVAVDHVAGHADLTTATGRIRVATLAGSAVLRNSNGATRVGSVDGDLRVKAANGAIEVGRATGNVVAKSANGDVSVDHVGRGAVVLETHVGDVQVGIPVGTAAWLDLDATAGRVDNRLDASADAAQAAEQATEKVEVRARTTLGRIVVRRPEGIDHV